MLRHTTLLAILITLILATLPSFHTAQSQNYPSGVYRGWSPRSFATSPQPSAKDKLIFVVDGQKNLVAVNSYGRIVHNVSYVDTPYFLDKVALDYRYESFVYVTAYSYSSRGNGQMLLVFDGNLTLQTNLSLSTLKPATNSTNLQMVIDSFNNVYLFDGTPSSNTRGNVWVLNSRSWRQGEFMAPIDLANHTGYVIGIDGTNFLYFQAVSGWKQLYISNVYGEVQAQFQLGTGNTSDPRIDDIAIDWQMRMWHTHAANSYISVFDSYGKLLAVYDILSDNTYHSYRTNHIVVDAYSQVVVLDANEQSLLYVSQRGDITKTVSSFVAPLTHVSELLGDYVGGGRAAGSLLVNDYLSPYPVQRISADDYDTGALLQRYSLPAHLDGACRAYGVDIGSKTGNIYMLLYCDHWPRPDPFALVYVVAQSGSAVSEFRVFDRASRVRVDESAATIYIGADGYRGSRDGSVMAYSMIDGTNTVNFTGHPGIEYITDMTLIMPGPMGGSTTIVVVDEFNNRFILFDSSNSTTSPVYAPFPRFPITHYTDITFSFGIQPSFYVSGTADNMNTVLNFVHKFAFDPNSNASARLTDSFIARPGVTVSFGPIVVGLDRHLYAYEYKTGSLYQWRDADRPPPPPANTEPVEEEPRVHVGEAVVGSGDAQDDAGVSTAAATPRMSVQNRHSRMRAARSA